MTVPFELNEDFTKLQRVISMQYGLIKLSFNNTPLSWIINQLCPFDEYMMDGCAPTYTTI